MSASTPEPKGTGGRHAAAPVKQTPEDRRVQVTAAKLRVALDEHLGRQTPPQTKALAKEDF